MITTAPGPTWRDCSYSVRVWRTTDLMIMSTDKMKESPATMETLENNGTVMNNIEDVHQVKYIYAKGEIKVPFIRLKDEALIPFVQKFVWIWSWYGKSINWLITTDL